MTTAVITGAGSGLGQAITVLASQRYDNLILLGRNMSKLRQTAEMFEQSSESKVFILSCDLTQDSQIQYVSQWINTHFSKVDLLVNNAGLGYFETLDQQSFEQINQTINTDLLGAIKLTRLLLPQLVDHDRHADIVNVASIAGKIATAKTTTYAAAKFGMVGFSNALRLEMKQHGVRVHTINPGPMDTNFFNVADPNGLYLSGVKAFVIDAQMVAELVFKAIDHNTREVNVPTVMGMGAVLYTLFPHLGDLLANSPLINRK